MTAQMSRADEIHEMRKERGGDVLDGTRMRLSVAANLKDPDWEYRWVNQEGDRVMRLQEIGYEVVSDRNGKLKPGGAGMGSEVSAYAGTQKDGSAMKQVLMRIPKEIYHEDQRAKQRRINETEASIGKRIAGADLSDQAAFDAHPDKESSGLRFG